MFNYVWPIVMVVIANTFYQICSKSTPASIDPFASVTVTYAIATVVAFVLYLIFSRGGNITNEFHKLNWAPFVLGMVLVSLEVGFIFIYRAGWPVSTAAIVQSSFLAITLMIVGAVFFKEHISWNKIAGVAICLVGLYFLNK